MIGLIWSECRDSLAFSFRWEEKLLCGSVEPSPAALIYVVFHCSNLSFKRKKQKEDILCLTWVRVSRFVSNYLSNRKDNLWCCRHRAGGKQQSTGLLHLMVRISHLKEKNPEQLMLFWIFWSECRDSNSRPLEPHSSAIPNFATPGYELVPCGLGYNSTAERKNQAPK